MKLVFPAMKGLMGGRVYYLTLIKLAEVPRLLTYRDWAELPPEQRAQRVLSKGRIPEITRYIRDNANDGWLFSSITASYTGEVRFYPFDGDSIGMGKLEIEAADRIIINDGQHRFMAIKEALKDSPDLANQEISLLLFPFEDLQRTQQMFSDLNRSARPTSKSLNVLFDHTDMIAEITKTLVDKIRVFQGTVDKERVSLPMRSPKLTTLSAVYDCVKALITGKASGRRVPEMLTDYDAKMQLAIDFFSELSNIMTVWQDVKNGEIKAREARAEYVCCHAIIFRSLGLVGNGLTEEFPSNWKEKLQSLSNVDWRRTAKDENGRDIWEGKCLIEGDIIMNLVALKVTARHLKSCVGINTTVEESVHIDSTHRKPHTSIKGRLETPEGNGYRPYLPRRGKERLLPTLEGELFKFLFVTNKTFPRPKQSDHRITLPKETIAELKKRFPSLSLQSKREVSVRVFDGKTLEAFLYRAESGAYPPKPPSEYWQLKIRERLPISLATMPIGTPLVISACVDDHDKVFFKIDKRDND